MGELASVLTIPKRVYGSLPGSYDCVVSVMVTRVEGTA